jgi:hypothetical protein
LYQNFPCSLSRKYTKFKDFYKRFSYCDFCISIFQFRKQKLRLRDLQEKEEDQKWKNLPPRERMRIRKQQQADQEAERLR